MQIRQLLCDNNFILIFALLSLLIPMQNTWGTNMPFRPWPVLTTALPHNTKNRSKFWKLNMKVKFGSPLVLPVKKVNILLLISAMYKIIHLPLSK